MTVNKTQQARGTGLMFKYENKPYENEDGTKGWVLNMIVKEAGYGENILQSFPFEKTKGMDRYAMEYEVLMGVLCIFTETTLLQYNEIGKMMNTDIKLQEKVRKIITE